MLICLPRWKAAGGGGGVEGQEFTYSSDGDTNGVFYWLGTEGGVESWTNPLTAGFIAMTSSATHAGSLAQIVDRTSDESWLTAPGAGLGYIQVNLKRNKLLLKGYSHRNRNNAGSENTVTMVVSGSNDGINFTEIGEFTHTNLGSDDWNYIPVTGETTAYRFLKFNSTDNNGNTSYMSIAELELYGTLVVEDALINLCTEATASATSHHETYVAAYAIDDDPETWWWSGTSEELPSNHPEITIEFDGTYNVQRYILNRVVPDGGFGATQWTAWTMYLRVGGSWVETPSAFDGEGYSFTPANADAIKFRVDSVAGGSGTSTIREIDVYGAPI